MGEHLVVVDAQRAFAEENSPWRTHRFEEAIAGARRLAQVFGARTILTRFVPPPEPAGAWVDYYERWRFAREPSADALWELVDPWTGAAAVDCPTLSKWGPALAAAAGEAPTLVLCGVSTDCCVLATALAAIDAGAHVRVVADACAAEPALHRAALDILGRRSPQLLLSSVEAELAAAAS
jgi:nicotinamidase-related amidase